MTSMIELVARAITIAEGDDPDGHTGSLLNNHEVWWEHRIPQARAAMEAMRHYNFEMEQACMKAMKDGEPFELVWERAFNVALSPS